MSFADKIIGAINNPKETMKRITEEPLIEEAVMIVGILAITGALAAYIQSYKINFVFENIPPGMESMFQGGSMMKTITIASSMFGVILTWIIGTGIIHFISKALGGEGKFYPHMITASGYSMIPQLIGVVLTLVLYLNMDPVTITMDIANPRAGNSMMNAPYFLEMQIVNGILMLWGAMIFVFGVQSAHKLSTGKAAVAVGIPLAFSIIMMLWNLWNIGML